MAYVAEQKKKKQKKTKQTTSQKKLHIQIRCVQLCLSMILNSPSIPLHRTVASESSSCVPRFYISPATGGPDARAQSLASVF